MIAFGFVLEKFNLFILALAASSSAAVSKAIRTDRLSGPIGSEGLAFMLTGVVQARGPGKQEAYKPRSPSPSFLLHSLPFTALRFSLGKKKPRVRAASGAHFQTGFRLPAPAATTVTVSGVPVTPAVAPTGVP